MSDRQTVPLEVRRHMKAPPTQEKWMALNFFWEWVFQLKMNQQEQVHHGAP